MPGRVPLPRTSERLTFSLASVGILTPLAFLLPGGQERLAAQTARWAPRWERSVSRLARPVERGVQKVSPRLGRAVQRVESRLPLERAARGVDGRIRRGLAKMERVNDAIHS